MILRLWLFLVLTLAGALAPSRASARVAETRTGDFFAATAESRQQNAPQVADWHPANPRFNYETASGYAQAAESGLARAGSSVDDLVAAAQKTYPGKAGATELHHVTPKYLGGAADGPLVPLNGSYHQVITNEFRSLWPYGGPKPSPQQLQEIMQKVYQKYPLPATPVTVGPGG